MYTRKMNIKTYSANYKPQSQNCILPMCNNTSKKDENKVFLIVPKEKNSRKKWFEAIGIEDVQSKNINLFVCEDHFDLEEDLESYMLFKMMRSQKRLKADVVPHKFNCRNKSSGNEPEACDTIVKLEPLTDDSIDIKEENIELSKAKKLIKVDCVKHEYDELIENKNTGLLCAVNWETTIQIKIENEAQETDSSLECSSNDKKIEFVQVSNSVNTNLYNESISSPIIVGSLQKVYECPRCRQWFRAKTGLARHIKSNSLCKIHNNLFKKYALHNKGSIKLCSNLRTYPLVKKYPS